MDRERPEILNVLLNEWAWLKENGEKDSWGDLTEDELVTFRCDAMGRIRRTLNAVTDIGLYFWAVCDHEDHEGSRFLNADPETRANTLMGWLEDGLTWEGENIEPVEYEYRRQQRGYREEQAEREARFQKVFADRVAQVGHSQAHYEFYER
jgi:hypothetical protein